jgi:hypothetical protein
VFWKRRRPVEDRVNALEDRFDRVAIRQCVNEAMLAATVGLVLRCIGDDLRGQIIAELRKSARVDVRDFSDPAAAELAALAMEERYAQQLDEIEHLARAPAP